MQTEIKPVTFFKDTSKTLRIDSVQIQQLGEEGIAAIHYSFLGENGRPLATKSIGMSGDVYSAWGDDDDYVLNFVLTALDLEKA